MKKLFILVLMIGGLIIYGCKKSSSSPSITKSQWTLNGKTYTGDTTYFDNVELDLQSDDTVKGNYAIILFNSRPTVSANYTVINGSTISGASDLASTQCVLATGNAYDSTDQWYSNGNGGNVSATINGGKLTVKFSNVNLNGVYTGLATMFSGTLIEQ